MASQIWVGGRSRAEHLRRLSVVFAVELRLRIVNELYMREMSSKGFYDEFGGGTQSRVSHNFEKLVESGWLRHIRDEGPGGQRHGGVERFYRAPELAYCDADTWALLPYSVRAAFSWNSFNEITRQMRAALEAPVVRAGPERHFSRIELALDEAGWQRAIAAIDAEFVSQFEQQEDARRRIGHGGGEAIRANTLLVAFEAPGPEAERRTPELVESDGEPLIPFPVRLSKVFADEVALQIVAEANRREISPPVFHADHGGESAASIRRRFRMLAETGWLRRVGEKTGGKRRAAVEFFYRATGPAIDRGDRPWAGGAQGSAERDEWGYFERLGGDVEEATKAGSFDARKDRYLAWSALSLDQVGWENVAASMRALRERILEEREQAAARLRRSGEKPFRTSVALAMIEAPAEAVREL